MDNPEVANHNKTQNSHHSVSFEPSTDRRASPSSSTRTKVSKNAPFENIEPLQRRQTQVVDLEEPSWWDLFKALVSPSGRRNLKKKLLRGLRVEDVLQPHQEPFNHKECPYNITVSVYPYDKTSDPVKAMCVLDTGCLQGNIISAELAQRLGFVEFQPLSTKESNGGTVATGSIHKVIGAVHVSWYHFTATKIFQDMRFLVSETANVDLVIGTESIVNNNLINPPNLQVDLSVPSNLEKEKLVGEEARLATAVKKAQRELDEAIKTNSPDRSRKEKALHKKQQEKRVAELKLAIHNADVLLKKTKKLEDRKALEAQIAGLEAEKNAKEHKEKSAKSRKDSKS